MEKKEELEKVAQELLAKEIIFQTDLERLIGKRPFDTQTTYEAYTNPTKNGQPVESKDATPEILIPNSDSDTNTGSSGSTES